jgi:hypothetical protein
VAGQGGSSIYRIDRIEDVGHREVSAVRIEPDVYDAPVVSKRAGRSVVVSASAPVDLTFLDLPLLGGDESPHAPHIAVVAQPWNGPVAVYSANQNHGYRFLRNVRRPATVGTLLEPLPAGKAGQWMNRELRVGISSGVLQSREESEVLNGANVAALRFGTTGDWEVIQFQGAELIAPREYRLRGLLRGQAGTDGIVPSEWPEGTSFVLLDGAVGQLDLPASARGLERHFRVGPASRGLDHASYVHRVEAFAGVGLRPYRPVHLAAERLPDNAIALRWMRRTRIDGDSWAGTEVPLGEEREAYVVLVYDGAKLLREIACDAPSCLYTAAEQTSDGADTHLFFDVAQVSARFGPGPFERIEFHG